MYIFLLKDKKRAQRVPAEKTSNFRLDETGWHKIKLQSSHFVFWYYV
jgi:hypothetical protein